MDKDVSEAAFRRRLGEVLIGLHAGASPAEVHAALLELAADLDAVAWDSQPLGFKVLAMALECAEFAWLQAGCDHADWLAAQKRRRRVLRDAAVRLRIARPGRPRRR